MDMLQQVIYLGQLILAMILGGVIGFERELANKPAGLRTHMLVAGAAALFVIMAIVGTDYFGRRFEYRIVMADPVRIIQAIAVGISFIGAGTIIQVEERTRVKHLTTAASILFTAAMSIAVVLEQYFLAVAATLLAVFINRAVGIFEERFMVRKRGAKRAKAGNEV